jgi:hypothetical protein
MVQDISVHGGGSEDNSSMDREIPVETGRHPESGIMLV